MADGKLNPNPEEWADPTTSQTESQAEFDVDGKSPEAASSAPVISDTPDEADDRKPLPFNVVGLGASAGGIEAYIEILEHLPPDTGMAYVIVLHLAADQKSHLPEILARHTKMRVKQIESGLRIEPNQVYVAPPKYLLRLEAGAFALEAPDLTRRSIDYFFYSLATDQKNHAIGVILSGMDSDGALGMRAIKGEGGITIVQAPESAQYADMPRSSISLDHVDIVLTPSAIAAQLAQLGRQIGEANVRLLQEGALGGGGATYRSHSVVDENCVRSRFPVVQADHHTPPDCASHAAASHR